MHNLKLTPPVTLILGGNKIKQKIGILKEYLAGTDVIMLGGTIANTFLAAQGFDVAKSEYDASRIDEAREIMASAEALGKKIILPVDVIVADNAEEKAPTLDIPVEDIEGDMKILDIGKKTSEIFLKNIADSHTVIWSGSIGHYEIHSFSLGTDSIISALKNFTSDRLFLIGEDTAKLLSGKISASSFTAI